MWYCIWLQRIFTCESLTQVAVFLLDIVEHSINLPQFVIYDNACHLESFLKNTIDYNVGVGTNKNSKGHKFLRNKKKKKEHGTLSST